MAEYTAPTTAEIREQVLWQFEGAAETRAGELFDSWLAAHDAGVAAKAWDSCLDAIEQNELNTAEAREGNPYRALVGHGTPEPTGKEVSDA